MCTRCLACSALLRVLCTFSRCAHQQEAKETAMRNMPSPTRYRRCNVPGKTAGRSIVYDHGVRFEQDCSEPDPKKQRWFCAHSKACRALLMRGQGGIHCQLKQTGNVTRHLSQHGECPLRYSSTTTKTMMWVWKNRNQNLISASLCFFFFFLKTQII